MEYVWIIAFFILLGVELATMGLTTIWFAVGALVAYGVQLLGADTWVQVLVFAVVSVVIMLLVRPIAIKFINDNPAKTNVEALDGKIVKVLTPINNIEETGNVMINGIEWLAKAEDDEVTFEVGELVEIVRVEGVKAIVKKKTK